MLAALLYSQRSNFTRLSGRQIFEKVAIGLIDSPIGRNVLSCCNKLYIERAYIVSKRILCVDMIRWTLPAHARLHVKMLAESLREARHSLYHLDISGGLSRGKLQRRRGRAGNLHVKFFQLCLNKKTLGKVLFLRKSRRVSD